MTKTKKIMIVDDTEALLTLYKTILEHNFSKQFDIVTSINAEHALKYIKTIKDSSEILCVITDYEMIEMNGQDFSQQLRSMWTEIPIFLHTNTCIEAIPEIQDDTEHLNITVLNKKSSMNDAIIPWIKEQIKS